MGNRTPPLQLLVHGVGGATGEEMLDDRCVVQVAGDEMAGFYRGADTAGDREAYAWGGLTTGSLRGLLWVLLVPFALVNLVGFMFPLPPDAGSPFLRRAFHALVRVFGLMVTAFYTLWALGLAVDDAGRRILPVWAAGPGTFARVFADRPAISMALGATAVVLGLLFVNWLADQTRLRPKGKPEPECTDEGDPAPRLALRDASFWARQPIVGDLARLHNAAALVAVAVGCHYARLAVSAATAEQLAAWSNVPWLEVGIFALSTVALLLPHRARRLCSWSALLVSGACAAWAIVRLAETNVVLESDARLVSWAIPVRWLSRGMMIAVGCLCVLPILAGRWRSSSTVLIALAHVLLTLHLGATVMVVQLGASLIAICGIDLSLAYPPAYSIGSLWTLAVMLTIALLALAARRPRFAGKHFTIALVLGTISSVLMVLYNVGFAIAPPTSTTVSPWLAALGRSALSLVTIGIFAAIVSYWRSAATDVELRRSVARLWDVATFWPRWFHPFAPPVSAQRAVPELAERISRHIEKRNVLVAAHSQGTVVSFAAVQRLGSIERVALLTFGSPIRKLYAFFFPAYFGDRAIAEVHQRLGDRWVNLYRADDPIGASVFGPDEGPDDRLVSSTLEGANRAPLRVVRKLGRDSLKELPWAEHAPEPGHSDYELSKEYEIALAHLSERLECVDRRESPVSAEPVSRVEPTISV